MRALAQAGIREFTIDLNLPSIAAALTAKDALTDEQTASLYTALARKDATALAALPLAYKDTLVALLQTGGEAKAALYKSVGEPLTGRSVALANQTEDRSSMYLILFSIPKVTITADVVEFNDKPQGK